MQAASKRQLWPTALLALALGAIACSSAPVTPGCPNCPCVGCSDLARAGDMPSSPVDGGTDGGTALVVWPNAMSHANSDPWLVAHHDEIQEMHPRVLALHFDNTKTIAVAQQRVDDMFAAIADGSRYHGYSDTSAKPFLRYELAKLIDLTDHPPPSGWTFKNSTRMPRKAGGGEYVLDIQKFFDSTFVNDYGYVDPADSTRKLTLCELFRSGEVHELWVINEQNDPEGTIAPEGKEQKQRYDANNQPIAGSFDECAGNGCFMTEDIPSCGVTVKFLSFLLSRGVGCQVHSQGHSIEGNLRRDGPLPAPSPDFQRFGNFDLDQRLSLPFASWYDCAYTASDASPCMTYTAQNAVSWSVDSQTGTIPTYDQGCGNVHFAPNSSFQYDYYSTTKQVLSDCAGFGLGAGGADTRAVITATDWNAYDSVAPDCGGSWVTYWRQSLPGYGNVAHRADGTPLRNWWPFLFY